MTPGRKQKSVQSVGTLPESDTDFHVLNDHKLRATTPRLLILNLFHSDSSRHLNADDVYLHLVEQGQACSLSTIYRVLQQLTDAGLLIRQSFGGDKASFELNNREHHDHLVCVHCGRIEEFCDPVIERLQHAVAESRGFALQDHALSLFGVCASEACRAKRLPRRD